MSIDKKPYIPDAYRFDKNREPEKIEPFFVDRVSDLPEKGGRFTLPPGTKIYKPRNVEMVIDAPMEVTLSPMNPDLLRARFVKSKVLSAEEVSTLPPNRFIDDTRDVSVSGNNKIGVIYGTEVREMPLIVEREI